MNNARRLTAGLWFFLALPGLARAEQLELFVDKKEVPAGYSEKIALEAEVPAAVAAGPRFFASAGELSAAEKIGDRRWRAWLKLPPVRHPYLVLVAAKVPGWTPAWGAVRLHAPVTLPVKTDKPRVNITLMLGGRQYGPVRTDEEGNCHIAAQVWPGEYEARANGVDEFGNKTQQKVDIPIPPSPLMLVLAEQNSLAADGQSTAEVWVLQVRPDGRPLERAEYSVRLSTGRLLDTVRRAPGVFRTRVTAPRGRQTDRLVCEIIDKRQPEIRPPTIELALTTGMPHSIKVEIDPAQLFSDGQRQSRISLSVLDRGGNLVAGFVPRISCPLGVLGEVKTVDEGYQVYYLPRSGEEGMVTCSAAVGQGDEVRADFSLILRRPRVALLEALTGVEQLTADGRSQAIIRLRAMGDHGRPIDGAEIRGRASLGTLSAVVGDGQGAYHAVYTAATATTVDKVRLEFSAEGTQEPVTAWVALRLVSPPPQPPPVPRLGIGVRGGVSANFDELQAPQLGLETFLRLPFGLEILFLGLEVGYLFDRELRRPKTAGLEEALVELDTLQLAAVFQVRLRNRSPFLAFVDTGAGAAVFSWRIKPAGLSELGRAVRPLVFAGLGGEMRLGSGAVFVQARFAWASLPGGELSEFLNGNFSGLQAVAGLRFFVY